MNKVDDVLISLLKAKSEIANNSNNKEVIDGLDNIITSYTIKNKMSNKEILDCAMSLYNGKKNNFFDKVNKYRPKNIIKKIKSNINNYQKKKELTNKYRNEIAGMVRDRLKNMLDEENINVSKNSTMDMEEKIKNIDITNPDFQQNINNTIINNGIIDVGDSIDKDISDNKKDLKDKVYIFDKDIVKFIDKNKVENFIFKDNNHYYVYRKSDNKEKLEKFDDLKKAVIYAISKDLSSDFIKSNFNSIKDNYGNINDYIIDKRSTKKGNKNVINNYNNINLEKNI